MNELRPPRHIPRSVGALLAGFFVVVAVSIVTDGVLNATGVFPKLGQPMSDKLLLLATAYRTIYSVAGCYVAARLAPSRPMLHALLLGFIGFILSIAGAAVTWNGGAAFAAKWYPLTLIALAIPCAWLGGWLREIELRPRAAEATKHVS